MTQIPKTFHQIWFGPPMPEAFSRMADTWRELHPDWEMLLWDEENLPPLANQEVFDAAHQVAPGFEGQLKSDIARYEILLRYGGVYIDVDFECCKPIDSLLTDVSCFMAWEIQGQVANNAIMGAVQDHPFLELAVKNLRARVKSTGGIRPSKLTGPHYVTALLKSYRGQEVKVFPQDMFYPYGCKELDRWNEDFPEAYGIHHWNNQRKMRKKPMV